MEKDKNSITTHDVAEHANVSQMTVSRVLRGGKGVSQKTIDTVEKSILELGYVHNKIAGSLYQSNNDLIGVIIPTLKSRVFNGVIEGINDVIDSTPMQAVFGMTNYSLEKEEKIIYNLLSWRPKAIIISGVEHTANARKILEKSGILIIEIMDIDDTIPPIHSRIGICHKTMGRDIAEHLLQKGYTKFACINSWTNNTDNMDYRAQKRYQGFTDTLHKQGLHWKQEKSSSNIASPYMGKTFMQEIINDKKDIEITYCSNDDLAMGAYMACQENNISIPKNMAIVGCNGLPLSQILPQRMTTTVNPRYEIGKQAAQYILSGDNTPIIRTLETEILIGETS